MSGDPSGSPLPRQSPAAVTDQISRLALAQPYRGRWRAMLLATLVLVLLLGASVGYLFAVGVGIWGLTIPTVWGLAIANYVWWIGIGNAGTFISAMLLILQQDWRNSLNRFAEAMTVFAVACAGLYPIIHLGRPWLVYFTLPYPSTLGVQPNFRSPLLWDVFANAIYLLVSVLFWYIGMLPDFATLRDKARRPLARILYGLAALGWRNSADHWQRWRRAYLLVAAMAMPLVVSVHSGVAMLFAAGPISGWHSTIFPPYFVLGAVFSGFAVVSLIALALRHAFALHNLITERHLDLLGKMILVTGLCTDYGYLAEGFTTWYGNDPGELATLTDRLTGTYAWVTWATLACNMGTIQLMWWRTLRTCPAVLAMVAAAVTLGMYTERFMLVVTSLYHGPVPAKWHVYVPSFWDWATFAGTVGLFLLLLLLFLRFLPMISMFELREVLAHERGE